MRTGEENHCLNANRRLANLRHFHQLPAFQQSLKLFTAKTIPLPIRTLHQEIITLKEHTNHIQEFGSHENSKKKQTSTQLVNNTLHYQPSAELFNEERTI